MWSHALLGWAFSLSALMVLFWLVPLTLAKQAVKRFGGRAARPIDMLLKELPGIVSGMAITALGVFLLGVSFEDFASATRVISV